MANIIQFKPKSEKSKKVKQALTLDPFFIMVEEDIEKLMKATNGTREDAIKLASDFFRRYPALTTWVSSEGYEVQK
jgi:hypothetical protein